jgi:hypothetical protein
MMSFSQTDLLDDIKGILAADAELSAQDIKFETGQPDVAGILTRLNGGQVNIVDLGVKFEGGLWRKATIGLIVSTRRPSVNDSDLLNTALGEAVERIIRANPQPGQFSTGIMGALNTYECASLSPFEDSPEVRVREITITYKIFRGDT